MSEPSGASTTTVDPGEIKQFAKFLDEVVTDFTTHVLDKVTGQQPDPELFGDYNESGNAVTKHDTLVTNAGTNLNKLKDKIDNIAQGTHTLSGQYHDLAELNKAQQDDIANALHHGAEA